MIKIVKSLITLTLYLAFFEGYIYISLYDNILSYTNWYYLPLGLFLTIALTLVKTDKEIAHIKKYYYGYILFIIFSSIINAGGFLACLYYIKNFALPLSIIIWLRIIDDYRYAKKIAYIFALNIALNFGWLLGINPLPNAIFTRSLGYFWDDFAIGTVGSSNVAFMSILMINLSILLAKKYHGIIAVFSLLITSNFALTGFSAPSILRTMKINARQIMAAVAVGIIAIVVFMIFLPEYYTLNKERIELVQNIDFPKFVLYEDIAKEFGSNPIRLLFGAGPGTRTSIASSQTKSEFYVKVAAPFDEENNLGAASIMMKYSSGIASLLWETGFIGFFLWLYIVYKLLNSAKLIPEDVRFNNALLILLLLWMTLEDIFKYQYNTFIFCFLIGVAGTGIINKYKLNAKQTDIRHSNTGA